MTDATQEYDHERYGEYSFCHPQHPKHKNHDRVLTGAYGVWYCYECEQHYRYMGKR